MAGQSVTVIARLHAKPGREAALQEECRKIIAPTRAEPGCLSYDLHQSPTDPSLLLFHEQWASNDDIDQHFKTPHVRQALQATEPLLAEPMDITRWRKILERCLGPSSGRLCPHLLNELVGLGDGAIHPLHPPAQEATAARPS
jgi:quinol monooxygenase YgiN